MNAQADPITIDDSRSASRQLRHWGWLRPGQFGLSALLIGTAIVAIAFAGWKMARDRDAPYRAMRQVGATVEFSRDGHTAWIDLNGSPVSDEQLAVLRKIKIEVHLDASGTPIGDPAIEQLIAVPGLNCVDLSGTQITAAGIRRLQSERPDVEVGPCPGPKWKRIYWD